MQNMTFTHSTNDTSNTRVVNTCVTIKVKHEDIGVNEDALSDAINDKVDKAIDEIAQYDDFEVFTDINVSVTAPTLVYFFQVSHELCVATIHAEYKVKTTKK